MILRPTGCTRTYKLFPHPTLIRAKPANHQYRLVANHFYIGRQHLNAALPGNLQGTGFEHCISRASVTNGREFGQPKQAICATHRSEEHTSELQSLMRISYAVFCLKKKIISTDT